MRKITILCFGASNVWGFKPGSFNLETLRAERYDEDKRWTMQLQNSLGEDFRVVEEGLNGRTTMFDDKVAKKPYRNGLTQLPIILEQQYPIDLVIFMLGTNDTKIQYSKTSQEIAEGMRELVKIVKTSNVGPDATTPKILLTAPQPIKETDALSAQFNNDSLVKAQEIINLYRQVATEEGIAFLDTSQCVVSSEIDGIHLDEDQLGKLAQTLQESIISLFQEYAPSNSETGTTAPQSFF